MKRPNPSALKSHPLNELDLKVTIEWDQAAEVFVTYVPLLNNISTFGPTEVAALDATAEMILGYIEASQDAGLRLPLKSARIEEIRAVLATR